MEPNGALTQDELVTYFRRGQAGEKFQLYWVYKGELSSEGWGYYRPDWSRIHKGTLRYWWDEYWIFDNYFLAFAAYARIHGSKKDANYALST